MSTSPLHPIVAGLLEAFSAPRLPDGLTGESLAEALRSQGFDAHTVEPVGPGPLEPTAAHSEPTLLTRGDFAYTHSRIVVARKTHDCARCDELIRCGEKYLRYRLSTEFSDALHLACADLRSENGSLAYDCADLRRSMGLPLRSAP